MNRSLFSPAPPQTSLQVAPPSTSAMAMAQTHSDLSDGYSLIAGQNPNPPTRAQLAQLVAVPQNMVASSSRGRRRRKQKGSVAKFFNVAAGRPYPRLTSLQQTIQVTLTTNLVGILASGATGSSTFYSKAFSLVDFGGSSAFLGVFDQYRLDQLEAWVEPSCGTYAASYPILVTCVDLDDANVPTTINSIEDHQQALSGEGQAGHYHKWQPHMAVAAYSGTFTSYSNMPATWIDSASTAVQHYGLKVGTYSAGGNIAYNLTVRALISFRAPGIN